MRIKHYKVTRRQVVDYFFAMDINEYLLKAYPICERSRQYNIPVWEYVILKIQEGTFLYKGQKVILI